MMQARLTTAHATSHATAPEVPGCGYFTAAPALTALPTLALVQRARPATPLDQMYAYFTAD
ncbi:MAG: hypothetical protein V4712_02935 [Pseudomonadota bacterium]